MEITLKPRFEVEPTQNEYRIPGMNTKHRSFTGFFSRKRNAVNAGIIIGNIM